LACFFEIDLPPFHRRSSPTVRIPAESARAKPQAQSFQLATCSRILVLKFDYIGDWTLCTPFLQNLRQCAPRATISAVVLERAFDLASACPHVDRAIALVETRKDRIMLRAGHRRDAVAFRRDYANRHFELAVVPRWDFDFMGAPLIGFASRAPWVFGFSERCTSRKRILNQGDDRFYTHVVEDRRDIHEVEHNLSLLEAMNGKIRTRYPALQVPDADHRAASGFLRSAFPSDPTPLLGLAPFASESKRTIPLDRLAEVARKISEAFGCSIVVIGGPGDRPSAEHLAGLLGPKARSAAGRLTLREGVALIRRCDALVGMDSAPAHIAAAVGTPVAVLSCHPVDGAPSHRNSPRRFAPWGDRTRVLVVQPASARPPCRSWCQASQPHCILAIEQDALMKLTRFIGQALQQGAGRWQDVAGLEQLRERAFS
jgi:heptosyltransferase-2